MNRGTPQPAPRTAMGRRALLGAVGAAGLSGAGAPAAQAAGGGGRLPEHVFGLGVASGDPLPDRVVIWTRLAPEPVAADGSGGMGRQLVPVQWEVAEDERMRRVVRRGVAGARAEEAHTVHVDVTGLRPDREYFYRFRAANRLSPVGRTRTAPAPWQRVPSLVMGFASCQRYTDGYYNAWAGAVADEPDLIVHLGDYFYEKDNGPGPVGRQHLPIGECFTLSDYRIRIAQARTDQDLQAAHAIAPWVVTWDDHEVSGNYADDVAETGEGADATPEEFRVRRAAAYQSYWEHMPLRAAQRPNGPDMLLYRRLGWGDLATFSVLDTRQYRTDQVDDIDSPETDDPDRTMLGTEQERWLLDQLRRSRRGWNVIAQAVPFFKDPVVGGPEDKWDGYSQARENILEVLDANRGSRPVVLSGDIHSNRAADLKADFADPASNTIGVEFTCTSISSSPVIGVDEPVTALEDPYPDIPHLRFRGQGRGYVRCTITPDQWRSDFRSVDTILTRPAPMRTSASWVSDADRPGLRRV